MSLHRFPKTLHLFSSWRTDADDIMLKEEETKTVLDSNKLVVQEKLDGISLGFSFDEQSDPVIQNKHDAADLDSAFSKKVREWYTLHENALFDVCGGQKVLFGEWLYWRHTLNYDRLPSFFMAHDIFDREKGVFMATSEVEKRLQGTGIQHNPVIFNGRISSLDDLKGMVGKSQFGPDKMEGLYLRADSGDVNVGRYKFVRDDFTKSIEENWRTKTLVKNHSLADAEQSWSYQPSVLK